MSRNRAVVLVYFFTMVLAQLVRWRSLHKHQAAVSVG
jgi:hypothetical protein